MIAQHLHYSFPLAAAASKKRAFGENPDSQPKKREKAEGDKKDKFNGSTASCNGCGAVHSLSGRAISSHPIHKKEKDTPWEKSTVGKAALEYKETLTLTHDSC